MVVDLKQVGTEACARGRLNMLSVPAAFCGFVLLRTLRIYVDVTMRVLCAPHDQRPSLVRILGFKADIQIIWQCCLARFGWICQYSVMC